MKLKLIKYKKIIMIVIAIVLVTITSCAKYRQNIGATCLDATHHTLLTIHCYNETPISEHLFLPIVSLGKIDDKNIPWGATIPDKNGNYYYTSFSSAGFVTPWLFMKIFKLPITEQSLYIFNTVLFVLSALLWMNFIYDIYKKNVTISIIGLVTYVFAPELLHSMGIIYWCHSVMQVTLLAQIIAFYKIHNSENKYYKIIFYLLTFINPYIEWTGYIANLGFAISEIMINWKNNKKIGFYKFLIILVITLLSIVFFIFHFTLRLDSHIFFEIVKSRFWARNISYPVPLSELFKRYIDSYSYLFLFILILSVWSLKQNKKLELKHGMLIFIITFPVLENFIMKQHAIDYSFDRMKLIFLLSFVSCELCFSLIEINKKHKNIELVVIALIFGLLNMGSYMKSYYVYDIDYITDNKKIAKYINASFPNSMLCCEYYVRGYINILFHRGVYENASLQSCIEITEKSNKQFAILLHYEPANPPKITGATIIDLLNNTKHYVHIVDHKLIIDSELFKPN